MVPQKKKTQWEFPPCSARAVEASASPQVSEVRNRCFFMVLFPVSLVRGHLATTAVA